jgi:uncharacterized protein (UPF0333 family)
MSITKRNIQFFRNRTVIGNYTTHQEAIEGATQKFLVIAQEPGLLDGEIVLYRYTINNSTEIHTIVGVVCEKDGAKHIEIVGNYDILHKEIIDYVDNTILSLDSVVQGSDANNQITVKVTQVDGVLSSVNVESNIDVTDSINSVIELLDGTANIAEQNGNTITLYKKVIENDGVISSDSEKITLSFADVAFSGKAEDVELNSDKFTATNVHGALEEIIDNLGDTYIAGTNVTINPEDNSINVPLGLAYDSDNQKIILTQGTEDNATAIDSINANEIFESAFDMLDGTATVAELNGNTVTLHKNVTEIDGVIQSDNDTIVLSEVAYTGDAEDVILNSDKFESTNVQDALEEIVENLGDTYTAGTNVVIDENNKINVPLGIAYDSTNKKIYLTKGINDDAEIIDSIEATDFIKDGMLKEAKLVEEDDQGNTGKFLKLTWNTDADPNADGTTGDVVYINVTEFIDTYTNGNKWIKVEEYKIYHNLSGVMVNPAEDETKTTAEPAINTATPEFGGTVSFKVPSVTVDAAGHVTNIDSNNVEFTLPNAPESNITTIQEGHGIKVSDSVVDGSNNHDYTVSVKLNENTNDMLTVDENGLNLNSVWDCGEFE